MGHRDKREVQRDKVVPSLGSRILGAPARLFDRLLRMWAAIFETPPKWTTWRAWGFAAVAASLLGATLVGMVIWGASTEEPYVLTPLDMALMAWSLVGAPIVIGIAARALRAPGSVVGTAFAAGGVVIVAVMITGALPAVRDVPRLLLSGTAAGTVETIGATSNIGWAEIEPAYVWVARMGTASRSVHEDGREETRSVSASPIVPAIPWAGPTSLFSCADSNWQRLAGAGSGTVGGRIELATGLELEAIQRTGVAMGARPLCVTSTLGGVKATLAIGLIAMTLWLAVFVLGGSWALMRIAGDHAG